MGVGGLSLRLQIRVGSALPLFLHAYVPENHGKPPDPAPPPPPEVVREMQLRSNYAVNGMCGGDL